jgi:hypothetical protein
MRWLIASGSGFHPRTFFLSFSQYVSCAKCRNGVIIES